MREARGGARGWGAGARGGRVYQAHGWRPMKAKDEEGVNEYLVGRHIRYWNGGEMLGSSLLTNTSKHRTKAK